MTAPDFFMEVVALFTDFSILAIVFDMALKSFLALSMLATNLMTNGAKFAMGKRGLKWTKNRIIGNLRIISPTGLVSFLCFYSG